MGLYTKPRHYNIMSDGTDWKSLLEQPDEEIDHICRDCQQFIGDDGTSLCDNCIDNPIETHIDYLEKNTIPEQGQCDKCGKTKHGKDKSGLCYACWRDAEAAKCRALSNSG